MYKLQTIAFEELFSARKRNFRARALSVTEMERASEQDKSKTLMQETLHSEHSNKLRKRTCAKMFSLRESCKESRFKT